MSDYVVCKNFLDLQDKEDILSVIKRSIDKKDHRSKIETWTAGAITGCNFKELHPFFVKYTTKIKSILNQEIIPTYSFWRKSHAGTDLPYHFDRPACEVTVSINLESSDNKVWPFFIVHNKKHKVLLDTNDAVIYGGYRHIHWREPLEQEFNYQLCFHYFLANGSFNGCKYTLDWVDVPNSYKEKQYVIDLQKQVKRLEKND